MGSQPAWIGRLREAARVPDHSILLFGASPNHTPAREPSRQADCPRCAALAGTDHDPVRDVECAVRDNGEMTGEPAILVCCCGRSSWDGTPQLARAVKRKLASDPEPSPDRTGKAQRERKGKIEYSNSAAYSDYLHRLRAKRKVAKTP